MTSPFQILQFYQLLTLSGQYLTLSNLIGFGQYPILTLSSINGF